MSDEADSLIIRGYKGGQIEIQPSRWMNTWTVCPHTGWRGFAIRRLRIPKRFFRPERRERLFYLLDGKYFICSYENYALIKSTAEAS